MRCKVRSSYPEERSEIENAFEDDKEMDVREEGISAGQAPRPNKVGKPQPNNRLFLPSTIAFRFSRQRQD